MTSLNLLPVFVSELLGRDTRVSQMKYRLLNCLDDHPALGGAERQACYVGCTALAQRRNSINRDATAKVLPPTMMISNISARNGQGLVTDGPFAETHELLGG